MRIAAAMWRRGPTTIIGEGVVTIMAVSSSNFREKGFHIKIKLLHDFLLDFFIK